MNDETKRANDMSKNQPDDIRLWEVWHNGKYIFQTAGADEATALREAAREASLYLDYSEEQIQELTVKPVTGEAR
jgi:hypothetical protein